MPDEPTSLVIQFRPPAAKHQLTTADRIEAYHWESSRIVQEAVRIVFDCWVGDDPVQGGDYISIYRGEDRWAVWGAARRGKSVFVWKCATGADLGYFSTMREALSVLDTASTEAPSLKLTVRAAAGRG